MDGPRKARRVIRDYMYGLYFPAQRLSLRERLRCTPLLYLVECVIYRVDAIAERARDLNLESTADGSNSAGSISDGSNAAGSTPDASTGNDHEAVLRYRETFVAYKARLESLLRRTGAYNDAVARQMELGEQYVYLENKITSKRSASHAEVLQLAELRPSDVRLLHSMTYAMLNRPVDGKLLDLLWPVEVLADIGDDLTDYYRDVAAGRFNTYDAFVRLYGSAAPDRLRAEIVRYEQDFHTKLAAFPEARRVELAELCARRYRTRTAVLPEPVLHNGSRPIKPGGAA